MYPCSVSVHPFARNWLGLLNGGFVWKILPSSSLLYLEVVFMVVWSLLGDKSLRATLLLGIVALSLW
jgi:hypothetical protein